MDESTVTFTNTILTVLGSIVLLVLGEMGKVLFEPLFHKWTLKSNYKFDQRRKLKDELALHKGKLLNSAEQLNYRLLGFNDSIEENWHKVSKEQWFQKKNQYYINSFLFRLLTFGHYLNVTERSVLNIDTQIADKEDIKYLKYVKSMINIFSDGKLHDELEYNRGYVSQLFKFMRTRSRAHAYVVCRLVTLKLCNPTAISMA
jgi:hypothetical protein